MIRRTTYAVAIEKRAKDIQTSLGARNYNTCLENIDQIRSFCDHLEREIKSEKEANKK